MVDVLTHNPDLKEQEFQILHEMFQDAVNSPDLLAKQSHSRSIHESKVFTYNGKPVKLRYSYIGSDAPGNFGTVRLHFLSPDGITLARHRQSFAHNPETTPQNEKPEILISGRIDTDREHRGNGYGTGLIALMDDMILHALHTQNELRGKKALCLQADESANNWSSSQIVKIGFKQLGRNIWGKLYQ